MIVEVIESGDWGEGGLEEEPGGIASFRKLGCSGIHMPSLL